MLAGYISISSGDLSLHGETAALLPVGASIASRFLFFDILSLCALASHRRSAKLMVNVVTYMPYKEKHIQLSGKPINNE